MNELIAVVDDESDILDLVSLHLKKAGFRVAEFIDSKGFIRSLDKKTPDLVVLDLMLPDADGFDVCKVIRSDNRTADMPVIMLTAKTEEMDRVLGLEIGADDYVTKPFSPKELVARVRAVLRRKSPGTPKAPGIIEIDNSVEINTEKYTAAADGRPLDLTATEFKILRTLAENRGMVYSRDRLLDILWGNEKIVLDRTIDVHIKNLRDKLGNAGTIIKNIRGVGYKIEEGKAPQIK